MNRRKALVAIGATPLALMAAAAAAQVAPPVYKFRQFSFASEESFRLVRTHECGEVMETYADWLQENPQLAQVMVDQLQRRAHQRLPRGTKYEIRAGAPSDFGRIQQIAWYSDQGMQWKPNLLIVDNEPYPFSRLAWRESLGVFVLGRYVAGYDRAGRWERLA